MFVLNSLRTLVYQDVQLTLYHVREVLTLRLKTSLRSLLGLAAHLNDTAIEIGDLMDVSDLIEEVFLVALWVFHALWRECNGPWR